MQPVRDGVEHVFKVCLTIPLVEIGPQADAAGDLPTICFHKLKFLNPSLSRLLFSLQLKTVGFLFLVGQGTVAPESPLKI